MMSENKCKHCFEETSVIRPTPALICNAPIYFVAKGKRPTRFPQKRRINGSRRQEHQDFILVRGQRDGIATDSSTLVEVDGPSAVCHLLVVTTFDGAVRSAGVLFWRLGFPSTFVSFIGSLAEPSYRGNGCRCRAERTVDEPPVFTANNVWNDLGCDLLPHCRIAMTEIRW